MNEGTGQLKEERVKLSLVEFLFILLTKIILPL